MTPRVHSPIAAIFHRLLAVGGVGLVMSLTVFAASPALHEKLHGGTVDHGEDHCAVALFSSGVSLSAGAVAIEPTVAEFCPVRVTPAVDVDFASPKYLRQPERGPPQQS